MSELTEVDLVGRDNWWRRSGSKRSRFRYFTGEGKTIEDEEQLSRIANLVIPPKWHEVRICPSIRGRIQAVGLDDFGRVQYIYHQRFIEKQQQEKYAKLLRFGQALPNLRRIANEHLALPDLSREKVLAVVTRLINDLYFRVGNEMYTKRYRTFGITTLRNHHLKVGKSGILMFQFIGKHHLLQRRVLTDPKLGEVVLSIRSLPGSRLFQFMTEDGSIRPVRASDVNAYIRKFTGDGFTAKDFRVWAGTVLAAAELAELGPADTETGAKKNVTRAISRVAERLGNTAAVCRSAYVHPTVIDLYHRGLTIAEFRPRKMRTVSHISADYEPEEEALLKLLSASSA